MCLITSRLLVEKEKENTIIDALGESFIMFTVTIKSTFHIICLDKVNSSKYTEQSNSVKLFIVMSKLK